MGDFYFNYLVFNCICLVFFLFLKSFLFLYSIISMKFIISSDQRKDDRLVRLYHKLNNEIKRAIIMKQKAERQRKMGLPKVMRRGNPAFNFSLHVSQNILRQIKKYKNNEFNEICEEIEAQIKRKQYRSIRSNLKKLKGLII